MGGTIPPAALGSATPGGERAAPGGPVPVLCGVWSVGEPRAGGAGPGARTDPPAPPRPGPGVTSLAAGAPPSSERFAINFHNKPKKPQELFNLPSEGGDVGPRQGFCCPGVAARR